MFHLMSCVQVVRAAEEAASTLAGSIHPEQCIKVLCPIVQTADYPINLAAIKMQTKVIERIAKDSLLQLLPDIIPGLLQVWVQKYKKAFIVKVLSTQIVGWRHFLGNKSNSLSCSEKMKFIFFFSSDRTPYWGSIIFDRTQKG